jgi:voltage-gated potassium channel
MSATDGPRPARRRMVIFGLLRAVGSVAVLIALYYVLPLSRLNRGSLAVAMVLGLLLLGAMTAHQVRAILRAAHPAVRAFEALATSVPLFLLLFAASYFLMSRANSSNFNVSALTRTDALYFTVTVFATVGFGDIVPASPAARLVVTTQMILNLIVIGLGVRLIVGAAQRARSSNSDGRIQPR